MEDEKPPAKSKLARRRIDEAKAWVSPDFELLFPRWRASFAVTTGDMRKMLVYWQRERDRCGDPKVKEMLRKAVENAEFHHTLMHVAVARGDAREAVARADRFHFWLNQARARSREAPALMDAFELRGQKELRSLYGQEAKGVPKPHGRVELPEDVELLSVQKRVAAQRNIKLDSMKRTIRRRRAGK